MWRALLCCLMGVCSCAPLGDTSPKHIDVSPERVRLQQAERTSLFNELVGRGIIEFHWSDEQGNHRAQGDFDFWRSGDSISLRISKGSEPLMWVGGDQDNHWMFDMLGDETKLVINQKDGVFTQTTDSLVLLGLDPLPTGDIAMSGGLVTLVDSQKRTWKATFDPSTHRPLEITLYNGVNRSTALHRKGIKVEIPGKNRLSWPVTGGLIDIEDSNTNASTKIDFAWLSIDTGKERMDRVFDLAFLRSALQPTVVEESPQ